MIAFGQWIIIVGTILLLIVSSSDEITQMFFVAILGDYAKPRGSRVSPFASCSPPSSTRLTTAAYTGGGTPDTGGGRPVNSTLSESSAS